MEARFKHAISNGDTYTLDHSTAFLWNGSVGCTWQCTSHFTSLTLFNFLKNNRILKKNFFITSLLAQYWSAELNSGHIVFSTAYAHCHWWPPVSSCTLDSRCPCFVWAHGAITTQGIYPAATTQGTSSGMERSELVRRRMKKRKGLAYCTEQREP